MKPKDQVAFEERLEEHRGIVFKLAKAYCPAGEERDDLVQEICLQLWRSYPGYDGKRPFSTWMYRVSLNTAISFARTARARGRGAVPFDLCAQAARAPTPPASGIEEQLAQLERFLQRLGELDRALVVLYLEERSHHEIGEILGISQTNVGTKLSRLKTKMRRELAPDTEEAANGIG